MCEESRDIALDFQSYSELRETACDFLIQISQQYPDSADYIMDEICDNDLTLLYDAPFFDNVEVALAYVAEHKRTKQMIEFIKATS